uniref:START domain-containing protein n=1 Tax=Solanum lycopersicum TaxID=4081 RepID=A0A3Q7IU52_SOLLC
MTPSPQEHDECHHDSRQQTIMFETVVASMNEMVELWKMNDTFWIDSSSDRRCFIHRDIYGRKFSNQVLPYQTSTGRIESSKDCGIVSMTAMELIHNFLDPVKWMNLFPTIVTKAKTIEVLESGTWEGSMQLLKLENFSSYVVVDNLMQHGLWWIFHMIYSMTFIVVYLVSLGSSHLIVQFKIWAMAKVSLIIQVKRVTYISLFICSLFLTVTWVEHVQVYEKYQVNHIFRDLLCDREAYGAKRWIVTLQRMYERFNFQMDSTCPTRHDFKGRLVRKQSIVNFSSLQGSFS